MEIEELQDQWRSGQSVIATRQSYLNFTLDCLVNDQGEYMIVRYFPLGTFCGQPKSWHASVDYQGSDVQACIQKLCKFIGED